MLLSIGLKPSIERALASWLLLAFTAFAAPAADLSKYRDFRFGADVAAVAKQAGVPASQAKTLHSRPALIQQLEWRPQSLGGQARTEAVQELVFTFYDGELFRISATYDRYETEGLTVDDVAEAISQANGMPATKVASTDSQSGLRAQEAAVAQWQDPSYRFDLIRASFGPSFRLVGVLKKAESLAATATAEASRLDDQEAPQRDAARVAAELETTKARLDKARLVNKPKFRP